MGFSEAIRSVFSQYASIAGRASRSEYWYFGLFYFLSYIGFMVVSAIIPFLAILYMVFIIGVIIPSITVGIRRLHDLNKSGWWYLIVFIPFIGAIIMIIWFVTKGTDGSNDFGDDPLEAVGNDSGPKIV